MPNTRPELWEWSRAVNLDGAFYGLSRGARRIIACGQPGHIIATSSLAILAPPPGAGVYIATKAGVVGICESLRAEMAALPIGGSVIVPGPVRTNIIDGNYGRLPETLKMAEDSAMAVASEWVRQGWAPEVVALTLG